MKLIILAVLGLILGGCAGSGGGTAVSKVIPAPVASPVSLTEYEGNSFTCTLDQAQDNSGSRVLCWGAGVNFVNSTNPAVIYQLGVGVHVTGLYPRGDNFCITTTMDIACFGPLPNGIAANTCAPSVMFADPNAQPTFCEVPAQAWLVTAPGFSGASTDSCLELANVVSCSDQFWTTGITYEFGVN